MAFVLKIIIIIIIEKDRMTQQPVLATSWCSWGADGQQNWAKPRQNTEGVRPRAIKREKSNPFCQWKSQFCHKFWPLVLRLLSILSFHKHIFLPVAPAKYGKGEFGSWGGLQNGKSSFKTAYCFHIPAGRSYRATHCRGSPTNMAWPPIWSSKAEGLGDLCSTSSH